MPVNLKPWIVLCNIILLLIYCYLEFGVCHDHFHVFSKHLLYMYLFKWYFVLHVLKFFCLYSFLWLAFVLGILLGFICVETCSSTSFLGFNSVAGYLDCTYVFCNFEQVSLIIIVHISLSPWAGILPKHGL